MKSFLRLLRILHTVGRYRLDRLIKYQHTNKKLRLLLLVFKFYPIQTLTRGKAVRLACEDLGPIFIKFGQLLSTRPDTIPPDIIEELDHLQDNVAPFSVTEFRNIVEKVLGNSVENLFKAFSSQPLASASVAQVHTAQLHSGQEVVVKVIRPNIEIVISQDIRLLQIIANVIESFSPEGRRLKLSEIIEDYKHTILDELNLMQEAANASQLKRNFIGSHLLYVPQVYWEYTREKIMVMERIYGVQVTDITALKAQNTNFKLLAERGVEIFFTQVFEHNFFHADMHPGNVFISKEHPQNPSYIAVDMAIVGSLTREDQYYLARNLLAIFRRDYRQVAELHVLSGWVPKETSIGGFESAIRAVCEPIFEKPIKEISFGHALVTLFKTARRYNMQVQPQLVLLQKTLINIEGLGRQLYPDLNLWDTAHPFLERWLKARFHPKNLLREFRYHAPEWMEKLPNMPHLVYKTIEEVKTLAELAPELRATSKAIKVGQQHRKNKNFVKVIALTSVLAAIYVAFPEIKALPIESILLTSLALIILFFC